MVSCAMVRTVRADDIRPCKKPVCLSQQKCHSTSGLRSGALWLEATPHRLTSLCGVALKLLYHRRAAVFLSVQEVLYLLASAGVAELSECLCLDLADTLTGNVEALTYLLKSA